MTTTILSRPFLTDLDSRAAIKGSRDALGLVPVWSRFGRTVVGNLTTVSNSVRGFTTLLLGYYFAEEAQARDGTHKQTTLDLFLKFEQLAAYSRWHVKKNDHFRGRDRVVLRLASGPRVTIGADPINQILSNQKTYGLWGLFSTPARSSGLLATDEVKLSNVAREFVAREYVRRLSHEGHRDGRAVIDLLRRDEVAINLDGREAKLAQALASILSSRPGAGERAFYDHHLVNGGDRDITLGCQPQLGDLLGRLPRDTPFDMAELRQVAKWAAQLPDGDMLATNIERIEKVEALLVPLDNAFSFLLGRDGQALAVLATDLRRTWGRSLRHIDVAAIDALRSQLTAAFHGDGDAAQRFVHAASALAEGNYEELLQMLLDHNSFVMQARNGSQPWVRLENGRVDVRYRDESAELIPGDELPHIWRNTYFINSLKDVVTTVGGS